MNDETRNLNNPERDALDSLAPEPATTGVLPDGATDSPAAESESESESVTDTAERPAVGIEEEPESRFEYIDPAQQRKRYAIIGGAALALAIVAGLALGLPRCTPADATGPGSHAGSAGSAAIEAPAEATETARIALKADGWAQDEGASPIFAIVATERKGTEPVRYARALWPKDGADLELQIPAKETGATVSITWVGSIASDGGIWKAPATETPISGTNSTVAFTKVDKDEVTQEQIDAILDGISDAVSAGDETGSHDFADAVDTAQKNAETAKDAIAAQKEEDKKTDGDKKDADTSKKDDSGDKKTETGSKVTGSTSDKETTTSGSQKPSGGSSSGSSTNNGGTSKPSHTHNWVDVTETRWVEDSAAWTEEVWVVDQAAWTETIPGGSYVHCNTCGADFSSSYDWNIHNREMMLTTGTGHSYSPAQYPDQVITHPEQGHWEKVTHPATGHNETVVVGQKCSGCGATK